MALVRGLLAVFVAALVITGGPASANEAEGLKKHSSSLCIAYDALGRYLTDTMQECPGWLNSAEQNQTNAPDKAHRGPWKAVSEVGKKATGWIGKLLPAAVKRGAVAIGGACAAAAGAPAVASGVVLAGGAYGAYEVWSYRDRISELWTEGTDYLF